MVQIPKVTIFSSEILPKMFSNLFIFFSQGGQFSESKDSKMSGNFP